MKKLCALALVCLMSYGAKAQASAVQVTNNKACHIYLQFFGNTSGSCTPSAPAGFLLVIPPGSTHTATLSMLSLPPGGSINFVRVYDRHPLPPPTGCPGVGFNDVGESCAVPSSSVTYNNYTVGCNPCGSATATWTSPAVPLGTATFVVN